MTPPDIDHLVMLCRTLAGLSVSPDKTYIIESRLTPVARREGFMTAADLMAAVRAGSEDRLAWAAVEAMTVSQTTFFRDRAAFAALRDDLLPRLAARRSWGPIRIWSAGCASGAEAYSLAMTAMDAHVSVEVVGSDISERSLEKARSGLFTQFEVQRGLPVRHLLRYFMKHDESWSVSDRLRAAVSWRRDNLLGDLQGLGSFDVILCRHVLSMMDPAIHGKVLATLRSALAPDGYLILAPGEGLAQIGGDFAAVEGHPGLFARDAEAYRVA